MGQSIQRVDQVKFKKFEGVWSVSTNFLWHTLAYFVPNVSSELLWISKLCICFKFLNSKTADFLKMPWILHYGFPSSWYHLGCVPFILLIFALGLIFEWQVAVLLYSLANRQGPLQLLLVLFRCRLTILTVYIFYAWGRLWCYQVMVLSSSRKVKDGKDGL